MKRRLETPEEVMRRIGSVLDAMDTELREIEADDRYPHTKKEISTIVENAPRALIQLEMRTRRATIMRYADKLRGEK